LARTSFHVRLRAPRYRPEPSVGKEIERVASRPAHLLILVLEGSSEEWDDASVGQAASSWGEYRKKVKAGRRTGHRIGFPRSKRRKHEQGFRADNGPCTVKVDGKVVTLPKIGRVVMAEELRFNGSIREVTVNRTAGTWLACFCVEDGQEPPPVKAGPTVGVDVGVGTRGRLR